VPNDDFESITESGPLVRELRERIAAEGAITFRAFMEAALYHPRWGYYATRMGATTRGGDYVTSPEVHPVFGSLVAKQALEFWRALGHPGRFDLVEAGAGSGILARDVLRWSDREPGFAAALHYQIVEPLAALRDAQRATLADGGIDDERIRWCDALPAAIDGMVLSNELLDAFPVHRVVREGDALREVYVGVEDGRFVDRLGELSDARIAAYFDALGLLPGEGCYAEVNLDASVWIADVAGSLRSGYALMFDYGYEAADLYAPWRRDGTLLCFYRQTASSDPYQRIGKQDMTASVDFTTLRAAGEQAGLTTIARTDQASFLARLGVAEGVAAVARHQPNEMEEYFARRKVVMDLIDPARLGRITVLLQGKGVAAAAPRGFRDGEG
jgi:SAM-dependent MidA family methyltransferase